MGSKVRNDDGSFGLKCFFWEEGKVVMLEAKDMKNPDNISPFIRDIVHRACGESEDDPVTSVFTIYIDVMNKVCGYEKCRQCNRRNLIYLEKQIKKFEK